MNIPIILNTKSSEFFWKYKNSPSSFSKHQNKVKTYIKNRKCPGTEGFKLLHETVGVKVKNGGFTPTTSFSKHENSSGSLSNHQGKLKTYFLKKYASSWEFCEGFDLFPEEVSRDAKNSVGYIPTMDSPSSSSKCENPKDYFVSQQNNRKIKITMKRKFSEESELLLPEEVNMDVKKNIECIPDDVLLYADTDPWMPSTMIDFKEDHGSKINPLKTYIKKIKCLPTEKTSEKNGLPIAGKTESVPENCSAENFNPKDSVNLNVCDIYGNNLLHCSVSNPKCTPQLILEFSLRGANLNSKNNVGDTPLNLAVNAKCSLDVIKMLLEEGAYINSCNNFRDTPLHRALDQGDVNLELVELLLEEGADVNAINIRNEAAVHLVFRKANADLVHLLVNHSVTAPSENRNNDTLLHLAVENRCHIELVNSTIRHGTCLEQRNRQGDTALELALHNPMSLKRRMEIVNLLLDYGASCNQQNPINGNYPLHTALRNDNGTIDAIQMLLSHGAIVNMSDFDGNSVLHAACISYHCNVDIVRLLLDNGANINATNSSLETPLFSAVRCLGNNSEKVKLLVERGATLDLMNNKNQSVLHVAAGLPQCDFQTFKLLLEKGPDINQRYRTEAASILFIALASPSTVNVDIVRLVLSKLVLVSRKWGEITFNNPLDYAFQNPRCPVEVIELLLKNTNLSINDLNVYGETPMHYCLLNGNMKLFRYALAKGGLVHMVDRTMTLPLQYAIKKHNIERDNESQELVKLLIKYSVLEGKYSEIKCMIKTCWDSSVMIEFGKDCCKEMKEMVSEKIAHGLTLYKLVTSRQQPPTLRGKKIKWDVNRLFNILVDNKYPVYKEEIAAFIKREEIEDRYNDILIYNKSEITGVKHVLNYHIACHLINFLKDRELLNMLLAFYRKSVPSSAVFRKKLRSKNNNSTSSKSNC